MPDNASRRGAVDMGMPLMLLAFVAIGGFMFWLNGQATAEREMRLVEEAAAAEEEGRTAGIQTVAPADIQMDATPFEGQEIRVSGVEVASLLGTQGFWLEMPNGNPFLVSLTPEVTAAGTTVEPGRMATVVGTVVLMTDSILTVWTEGGSIAEGDRIVAEFATHFIEATDVRVSGGGGAGGG
jgi:hypothetical protein